MSCNNTQVYTPKQNPIGSKASITTPKQSPFSPKNSVVSSTPVPLSNMCLDYVVENFQNGDFFATQDGGTLLFNLAN